MKRRHLLHTAATLPFLSCFAFLSAPTNAAKASANRASEGLLTPSLP